MMNLSDHKLRPAFTKHLVQSGTPLGAVAEINSTLDGQLCIGKGRYGVSIHAVDLWIDFLVNNGIKVGE
jgi:hypothetical protein